MLDFLWREWLRKLESEKRAMNTEWIFCKTIHEKMNSEPLSERMIVFDIPKYAAPIISQTIYII